MKSTSERRAPLYESPSFRTVIERLAVNVRRLREGRGWTQEECAERCHNLGPAILRTIEAGDANVTAATVARLCDGLEVDVLDLYAHAPPLVRRRRGRPTGGPRQPKAVGGRPHDPAR